MRKHNARQGQATVEYVVVVAVVLAALIAAIGSGSIGGAITALFSKLGTFFSTAIDNIPHK